MLSRRPFVAAIRRAAAGGLAGAAVAAPATLPGDMTLGNPKAKI